jgi:hypothetical protein
MNEEEFLVLFRKTKAVIDEASSRHKLIGAGTFLSNYDKYKEYIFEGYTKEALDSSSFREYVWHMMGMTLHLDNLVSEEEKYVAPTNVVNFYEYRSKRFAN